jgi:hypothetical protein
MARNYPVTIPACYAKDESLSRAYAMGWNRGHGIACHNVPSIGEVYWTQSMGKVKADADNVRDIHQSACFEAESQGRDYSPFEFIAHEFNESDDADMLWEAFEIGIGDAIMADLAEYTDADYGSETVAA